MTQKETGVRSAMFAAQEDKFWQDLGVFPTIMRPGAGIKDYRAQAVKHLRKCGSGNLRLICETAMVPAPKGAGPDDMVARILEADQNSCVQFLADFLRGKGHAVSEEYDSCFTKSERRSHQAIPRCQVSIATFEREARTSLGVR